MTTAEYQNIVTRVGGEDTLLHILRQVATCKDQMTACELAEHLSKNLPLHQFFIDNLETPIAPEDGTFSPPIRNAYLELSISFGELRLSFGICYGGEAGGGAEYVFSEANGTWTLTRKPDFGWIH